MPITNTPVMDRLVARSVEQRLPLNVHLDLTYRCNERCVHCYLEHEDHGELNSAEVRQLLDELAEAGTLFLTLSGGEIFLRQDLFELLDYARKLHFDISLKSNALLVTAERACRLQQLGVRRVQISIYSDDPAVHDAITKVPGSLQRSLRAVELLKARGIQVKLACPLMRQNLTAFRGVQALAEELGIGYVLDLTITPMIDGNSAPLVLRAAAQELLPVLQDRSLNPRVSSGMKSANGFLGDVAGSGSESDAYDDIPCCAGHNSCYISPYGGVYPCVQMPLPAGNIRQQSFESIWRGASVFQQVRAVRESNLPVCAKCSLRAFCERCPGLAHMEGGGLLAAYERACELAEVNARLAGIENPVSALHLEKMAGVPGPALFRNSHPAAQAR